MAKNPTIGQKALVEAFGTFLLTFIGAGAVIATYALAPTYPALLIIALANGVALALAVTVAMNISGGHINPAVTIGALVAGKISKPDAVVYIAAQLAGAFVGGLFLLALYPAAAGAAVHYGTPGLGSSTGMLQGILFEAVATFFLVFVVFGTAIDKRAVKVGGFAIGLTVMVDVLAIGPFTGGAMNPARAIGPTIASMFFANWYVYWIGPILGGIVAALFYKYLILKD
ncbi:MAG TPA: aquaporin [Candidatus Baltobacteraceae bacterium]|nr:aquaporin [Candidatus Baltobacteraceae bacterium]